MLQHLLHRNLTGTAAMAALLLALPGCSHSTAAQRNAAREQVWQTIARDEGELPPAPATPMHYTITPGNNPPPPHNVATPDNWVGGFGPPGMR